MIPNYPESPDDPLEPTFSALRAKPIPDGPPDELMMRTIGAMKAAAAVKPTFLRRVSARMFTLKMAASFLMVMELGAALTFVMFRSQIGLALVIEKVKSAHSLGFLISAQTPGAPTTHVKMLMNDQGQLAGTTDVEGVRMVWDMKVGRFVMFDPKTHTAVQMDIKDLPDDSSQPGDLIDGFKNLQGDSAKDLGATKIDGHDAEEFQATQDRMDYTVWADRHTGDPIRIDVTMHVMGKQVTASITDFELNPEIPGGYFDLNIPPGYTTQQFSLDMPSEDKGEQNLIDLLRGFVKRSAGKFPANLDDIGLYIELLKPAKPSTRPQIEQADMQWIMQFQMVQHFLGTLPKDDWKYLGDGKTTNDEKSLIFWYRADKGYRGIYSNLSAADLSARPNCARA